MIIRVWSQCGFESHVRLSKLLKSPQLPGPLCPYALAFGLLVCQASVSPAQEIESGPGYHSRALKVPASGKTGFSRLPGSATGITFTNHLSDASAAANQIRMNGSGVAAGDVD